MERDDSKGPGTEQPNDSEADSSNDNTGKSNEGENVDEYGEPLNDEPHVHARKRPVYKRPVYLIGAAIVLLIAAIFGVRYWLYARSHETTDDAFIDRHIIQVSPEASVYVSRMYVTDNQQVNAGALLVELDARDYGVRVAQAPAALDAGLARQHQDQPQVTLTR